MLNIRRVVLEKEPTILFTLLQTHTLKYILKKKKHICLNIFTKIETFFT